MTDKKAPQFYVSTNSDKRTIRVSFWPAGTDMHVSMEMSPEDALSLIKSVTREIDAMPRIASAADLGIAA
jgi:hypothetical protein